MTDGVALEHQLDENGVCTLCNQQIAIPLTLDNYSDYLKFHCVDLTREGSKTVHTGGGIKGGMELDFTLSNILVDGSMRADFNYLKDFIMEFDIIIDYDNRTGLDDEYKTLIITQNDLDSGSDFGSYKQNIYYALKSDAIEVFRTVTGTYVNYYYQCKIELKSVSGYVLLQ